jgi:rod shape-determining protein MreC
MVLAQRTGRSRHRLALLVLTAATLLTLDFRGFGPVEAVQRGVRDVLEPVTSVADTLLSPISDAWNAAFDYNSLKSENERLRAELDELRGQAVQVQADRQAYLSLLEATEIDYVGDVERVAATVIRGSVGNFNEHSVTIDKGSSDGLEPGMAVVTGAGIVGRLDRVDSSTSTVELISSSEFTLGVRLVGVDEIGLGHGVNGEPTLFEVDRGLRTTDGNAEPIEIEIGSAVVTAAESRYPADIPVGIVIAVEADEDGLTQHVTLELAADVRDLGFVSVLVERLEDRPPLAGADPVEVRTVPGLSDDIEAEPTGPADDTDPDGGDEIDTGTEPATTSSSTDESGGGPGTETEDGP